MRESKQAVDKIKVAHREELMKLKKAHAIVVHNKNVEIKKADELVAGYEETFSELLQEMKEEKRKLMTMPRSMISSTKRHPLHIPNLCNINLLPNLNMTGIVMSN